MTKTVQDTAAYIAGLMAIDKSALPTDGGQRFNRLIFARSPYLLQHAENPVDWYEWGEAAFDKARNENLPMLLSIGYATCHWCHVMAHESFEDIEVATLLNRHFVCIKVDREERPDIDDFFMTVAQHITGGGGWPLNVFMTPDKRPFMTITYLPTRGRGGMSGLIELLANIITLWRQRPDMIEKNCRGIMEELGTLGRKHNFDNYLDITVCSVKALNHLEKIYDPLYGGFGTAPKFPMPIYLGWLIGQIQHHPHPNLPLEGEGTYASILPDGEGALSMALHTLRQMRNGGIWDQLAGGLHRYSVDQRWLVPHFEKMLYDQAMLALVAIDAFQATGDQLFSEIVADIVKFVKRELSTTGDAFCAALDADSEGVEGKFYVWDKSEIDDCLGADSGVFCNYYDISAEGNFDGGNILNIKLNMNEFCLKNGLDVSETVSLLERCRTLLLRCREGRIRPLRDDKIITSWNGLMIAALAKGGIVCGIPEYLDQASRAACFILSSLRRNDGRLLRSYLNGPSETPAFLEDYAFFIFGLLELYEATLEQTWLDEASIHIEELLRLFRDESTGEFTLTGKDAEQMPIRVSSDHDGVTPSALAMTARVLLRLAWICDRAELIDYARTAVSVFRVDLERNPLGHLGALQVLADLDKEPVIATLSGPDRSPELATLLRVLKQLNIPLLAVRHEITTSPAKVAICANRTCYPTVSTPEMLKVLLHNATLETVVLITQSNRATEKSSL